MREGGRVLTLWRALGLTMMGSRISYCVVKCSLLFCHEMVLAVRLNCSDVNGNGVRTDKTSEMILLRVFVKSPSTLSCANL